MKAFFINILLLAFITDVGAQKWDKTYGTYYEDEGLRDIIMSYDNGYLLSGNYNLSSWSNWLIKTDINGEVLWDKIITWPNKNLGAGMIVQNISGEIILGKSVKIGSDTWPSLIKLDSCGNKLWCRVFIDSGFMWGAINDVILLENGDVIALAWFESMQEIDKIFLYYIEADGNLVWRKSYASKNDHPLVKERLGLKLKNINNDFLISGWCKYPYPTNPNTGYIRPFFIGIDSLFEEKWILPFGVSDSLYGQATNVIPLNDSTYMGIGFMYATGSQQNSLYMFFNKDGEELKHSQITNSAIGPDIQANIPSSIARINDTLFVASTWFGPDEFGNPFGELIVDTAGNVYKSESRPNTEGISTLIKTFDNKFVIGCTYEYPNGNEDIYLYKINDSLQHDTIYPGNYTYDSLCPYQIQSGEIDISDCLLITDVGETPTPEEYFASLNTIPVKVYPNPAKGNYITFEYQNTEHHKNMELRCFDVYGENVHSEKISQHQEKSIVPVHNWTAGVYMGLVYSNSKVVGQTKFIIQK